MYTYQTHNWGVATTTQLKVLAHFFRNLTATYAPK